MPSWRKLAQFMIYHILCHEYWNKLPPIVYGEGVSDKLGQDGRATTPGLNHTLFAALIHFLNFFEQIGVYIRPFF